MYNVFFLLPALLSRMGLAANLLPLTQYGSHPSALTLPSPLLRSQPPNVTLSGNSSEQTGYQSPVAPNTDLWCDGIAYGTNLDHESCFDAWLNIGWGNNRIRWGQRNTGEYNIKLPYRFSSGRFQILFLAAQHEQRYPCLE